jgi:hypothetical protein
MNEINSKTDMPNRLSAPPGNEIDSHPIPIKHVAAELPDKDAIAHELQLICRSPFFGSSKRSQQFLAYVVQYRLNGNLEPLKERTIGADLFNRPAGYATGDDSVVRVQAGEVRRRLEKYYQAPPVNSHVRIELPLGSYAPEFRWSAITSPVADPVAVPEPDPTHSTIPEEEDSSSAPGNHKRNVWVSGLSIGALLAVALAVFFIHRANSPESVLKQFWSPMFASTKPLLICLPKPISYRPSVGLYNRHAKTPGEFDREVDRMNERPALQPDDKLVWSDMIEYPDLGVGRGDVAAAIKLSSLLGRMGKDSEVRIGSDYSFEDLRNSPAIIIGAFSNRWTMQMTSNLHFSFVEDRAVFSIREQGASGRSWYANLDRSGRIVEDYGIVTRLVNSSTGQFVVGVAGITSDGSEAAAEIASSPEGLEQALVNAPSDWKRKNVQILVKTSVSDGIAGPARVVAIYVW